MHGSFFSDGPLPLHDHGRLVFTFFFAAIYYWVPKMTGFVLNEAAWEDPLPGRCSSRSDSTFSPLGFAARFLGQARRGVTYPAHLHFINDWVSVSAFVLGLSMLLFLYNFVYSLLFARIKAPASPWSSLSLQWQLPSPVPVHNFDQILVFIVRAVWLQVSPRSRQPCLRHQGPEARHERPRGAGPWLTGNRRRRAAGAHGPEPQLGCALARKRDRILLPRLHLSRTSISAPSTTRTS